MIQDARADIVFISDRFPDRHPALVDGLGRILEGHGIPWGYLLREEFQRSWTYQLPRLLRDRPVQLHAR
jgi:hypothetical protein